MQPIPTTPSRAFDLALVRSGEAEPSPETLAPTAAEGDDTATACTGSNACIDETTTARTPPRHAQRLEDERRYLALVDAPSGRGAELAETAQAIARDLADTAMPRAARSSCSHRITLDDATEAGTVFGRAVDALLDVNHWADALGPTSAEFRLYDANGAPVPHRGAEEGDTIRIDLPGPAPYAWVRIESVSIADDRVSFVVRPTFDPTARPLRPEVTQHFFTSSATNTFTVERHGRSVRIAVEGRNETPNVGRETRGVLEPFVHRSTTIGAFGIHGAGFQHMQWDMLTEHLLESARR